MKKHIFRSLLAATVFTVLSSSAYSDYSTDDVFNLEGRELTELVQSVPFLNKDPSKEREEYENFTHAVGNFGFSYVRYRQLKEMCDGHIHLEAYKKTASKLHRTIFLANKWDLKYLDEFKDKNWEDAQNLTLKKFLLDEIDEVLMMNPYVREGRCKVRINNHISTLLERTKQAEQKISGDITKPKREF